VRLSRLGGNQLPDILQDPSKGWLRRTAHGSISIQERQPRSRSRRPVEHYDSRGISSWQNIASCGGSWSGLPWGLRSRLLRWLRSRLLRWCGRASGTSGSLITTGSWSLSLEVGYLVSRRILRVIVTKGRSRPLFWAVAIGVSIALSLALCYVILAAFSEIDEPRSKISSVIEAHAALVKVEFLAVLFSIGNVIAIFLLVRAIHLSRDIPAVRRSSFWKAYASWLGSRALAFLLASVNAISVVGDELVGDQHGTIAEQSRSLGAVLLLSIYLFAVSFRLGTRSYNLWKQLPLSSGDEVLAKDSRPRIVYMRSFRDDAMEIPAELARPVLHSYEVALVSGLESVWTMRGDR
jgi:hypothetical protein